jgi:hypothetical protein
MNELLEQFRERLLDNPLVTFGQILGLLVTTTFAIVCAWRTTKATGRKVRHFWAPTPSMLAQSILEALDGEILTDGESVLAGGAQIYPKAAAKSRVFIGKRNVDHLFSNREMRAIVAKTAEVRHTYEVTGLLAQMRPQPQQQGGPILLSTEKKRA